jgi:high-affinity Fe2+/Pb2+ permease
MGGFSSGEFLVEFAIAAAVGTAVFFHAERNQIKHSSAWASAVLLFLALGLPLYALHVRRVRKQRAQPPSA